MAWSKWENEITVPFANTGDKTDINIEESPDNTVSYEKGYTSDYEVTTETNGDLVASKYTISREELNSILYKLFSAIKELQFKNGYINYEWSKGIGFLNSTKSNTFNYGAYNNDDILDLNDSSFITEGYKYIKDIKTKEYINIPNNIDCNEALIYSITSDSECYIRSSTCPGYPFIIIQTFTPLQDFNYENFSNSYINRINKSLKYYIRIIEVAYSEELSTNTGWLNVAVQKSTDWKEVSISQDDIKNIELTKDNVTVTGTSSYSACETLLVTEGNIIKKINKNELDNKFTNINDLISSNSININSLTSTLKNKSDINHTHTVENITDLGILATKDKANLTSDVESILPISKGGTGNTYNQSDRLSVTDKIQWKGNTSKNVFRYEQSDKTEFGIPDPNCFILRLGNYNNRSYGVAIAGTWAGSSSRMYVCNLHDDTSSANWTDWKAIAFQDEIPSLPVKYTTEQGTWKETELSTGEVELEGYGSVISDSLELPKNIKEGNIIFSFTDMTSNYLASASFYDNNKYSLTIKSDSYGGYSQFIPIQSQDINESLGIKWNFKGILA